MAEEVSCPFCGVTSTDSLVIEAHIEENHGEGAVPLEEPTARDDSAAQSISASEGSYRVSTDLGDWVKCTRQGCGEYVLLNDIDEHLSVHAALVNADESTECSDDRPLSPRLGRRHTRPPSNGERKRKASAVPTILEYFAGRPASGRGSRNATSSPAKPKRKLPPGRLGRRELGPHAFEREMPDHVHRRLMNDALPKLINVLNKSGGMTRKAIIDNETEGLIPLLADLCGRDRDIKVTYLCSPAVKHIRKLRCDGNFCGYWNIQMLLSYLQGTNSLPQLRGRIPNVIDIQEDIEKAWDSGINPHGRRETGGIRGTRKWIGTSEAAAYFTFIGVPMEAQSFKDREHELAATALLDHVEAYFLGGADADAAEKRGTSRISQMAPMYLQRFGHSMTIVGLRRLEDGSRDLLVFDPSFETSAGVRAMAAGERARASPQTLLKAYVRSDHHLTKWEEFEVLVPSGRARWR